jgi:hypothetical protein
MSRRESWVTCPTCQRRVFRVTNSADFSWALEHFFDVRDGYPLPGIVLADGARWELSGANFTCPRGHPVREE